MERFAGTEFQRRFLPILGAAALGLQETVVAVAVPWQIDL